RLRPAVTSASRAPEDGRGPVERFIRRSYSPAPERTGMTFRRTSNVACGAALALSLVHTRALAKCPNEAPDDPACEPISSIGMPPVGAVAYFPRKDLDPYWGAAVEIAGFSWSNNNDAFGPSQGTLRLGAAYMRSGDHREMLYYRFGWLVSFEGNASRRFLIPYFGGGVGAFWET